MKNMNKKTLEKAKMNTYLQKFQRMCLPIYICTYVVFREITF